MRTMLGVWAFLLAAASARADDDPWLVDFRYTPPWWQTSICLPDDGQKTLVGKDGGLLYDFQGPFDGFKTKILAGVEGGDLQWVSQRLDSPRVPIVRTLRRAGEIEIETEAFAAPPEPGARPFRHDILIVRLRNAGSAASKVVPTLSVRSQFPVVPDAGGRRVDVGAGTRIDCAQPFAAPGAPPPAAFLERLDAGQGQAAWAAPEGKVHPAFRNVAIGWNEAVRCRFRAEAGKAYLAVFGLCEGWHDKPGQRILNLQVEGKTRRKVDLVAEKGKNIPAVFSLECRDENGDGFVDLAVAAADGSPDTNTILNVLWILEGADVPPEKDLLAGRPGRAVLARLEGGESVAAGRQEAALRFAEVSIPAGGSRVLAFGVARGRTAAVLPKSAEEAEAIRSKAEQYWKGLKLPYGRIEVPDSGVQALLDSSIRNIFQAREIKNGLPAFQVGPTCYRGLWVVDGSFILEAMTYVGLADEVRSGIKYLLSFQRPDGSFMLIDKHWKETGIVLWAVTRHARLTNDRAWLEEAWPKVEKGFAAIRAMRAMPPAGAPNAGLIPDGFSDGGIGGPFAEYTNVYWTMVGLRAAAAAARWLGKDTQAVEWQKEYEDFLAAFRKAAGRDAKDDGKGNRYVPIRMDGKDLPQRAQWAFMHAVFPGQVFAADDPIVKGNMAMLRATEQQEMVYGTGWMANGIWNYFGSFYAHGWLWLGDGEKAARTLYAFANHASPLLVWREEQALVGKGAGQVGDMPHNWASAEFIRLARHLLALERGDELHLFEGLPAAWVKPGMATRLREVATSFGPVSLDLVASADGREARLKLAPPARHPASKVVLHLGGWSAEKGTVELSSREPTDRRIPLR